MQYSKYFSIRAKGKQTAEIFIYEQIGKDYWDDSGIGAKEFAQELKALGDISKIILRINSPGGSVFEGLAIYNTLNAHVAEKEVHIDGIAASIASVVAMAGDQVIMPENALLMIHDPTGIAIGDAETMRKMAETLDKVKDSIITAYISKTKLPASEIADLMTKETWFSADEAVDYGFADEVAEPVRIAAQFDFSMFKNVPTKIKNFGGYKKMKDSEKNRDETNDKLYRKDLYAERDRVEGLLTIGREFKVMDLAMEFVSEGKTPEDLRKEILSQIKAINPGEGPNFSHISGALPLHGGRPFKNFGEQLVAIKNASIPGGKVDRRLLEVQNAATGLNETWPSEGGFLLQPDFTTELLTRANEIAVISPLCARIPVSGSGLRAPVIDETSRATGSRLGAIQTYWVSEGTTVTPKKPKFGMLEMNLKKLMGICYSTDELLSDSTALEAVVVKGFTEELSFMLDAAIIAGSGTNEPLGILNSGCLLTVDKEVGQLTKTIVAENVINMFTRMHRLGKQRGIWLINNEIWPQLIGMQLTIGTGGVPLFMPPGGLNQTPYNLLLGRPVYECEQAEALGTAGDIIFGDFGEYLLIDKSGINVAQSMHVAFLTDEQVFRFILRVNGQPVWKKARTPFKGSATVSPFVVLENR